MKVFVSWSGTTSRLVAEALAEWLPKVLQGVEPFVSAKDIDKGANWTVELARELEDAEFGIVCLAPDNLLSPWLNYETGAITKSVNSRVCPVLFGVKKHQIKPPMAQLQLTSIDKEDFKLLMGSLNKVAGSPLPTESLAEAIDVWWPKLDERLGKISVPKTVASADDAAPQEPAKPAVDISEMLEEVLQRVRGLDDRVRKMEGRGSSASRPFVSRNHSLTPAINHLKIMLQHHEVPLLEVEARASGIEVALLDELPTPLPPMLQDVFTDVAKKEEVRVRVRGGKSTSIFEPSGDVVRMVG